MPHLLHIWSPTFPRWWQHSCLEDAASLARLITNVPSLVAAFLPLSLHADNTYAQLAINLFNLFYLKGLDSTAPLLDFILVLCV